ncbi:MAG: hypothetical protein IJX99_04590 [Clostridia bacterium]|nr:hypothetical protein [Clostridia bacterium]
MKRVSYIGIFFDEETESNLIEYQNEKLPVVAPNMHCTFKYAPTRSETKNFFEMLGGKSINLKITGYASDGRNSGFLVELTPEQMMVYTNNIVVDGNERTRPAHITVSMAEDAHAADTGYLKFKRTEQPFVISGRAGALIKDKNKERVEFENPYKTIDYDER